MTVEQAWDRIEQWLEVNAPSTASKVLPAAAAGVLTDAEAMFPAPWPDDLRQWYRVQNGERYEEQGDGVFPQWSLLSLEDMAEEVAFHAEVTDDVEDLEPAPLAGTNAFVFMPEFVPIGNDFSGGVLFVDLRPGDRSGCVTEYYKEEADTHGPIWSSVSAMLDDIVGSLEHGRACQVGFLPVVVNDTLTWELGQR